MRIYFLQFLQITSHSVINASINKTVIEDIKQSAYFKNNWLGICLTLLCLNPLLSYKRPILFQFGIHNPQEHLSFQNSVAKYPLHHAGAGGEGR